MKCSLGIWWFGLGALSVVLACGPYYSRRMITGGAEVLQPVDSGIDLIFPAAEEGDSFPDRVSLLDERRKKTLEVDLADLRLAAPNLDPKILARYKQVRTSMIGSQGQFIWDDLKKEELHSEWEDNLVLKSIPKEFSLYLEGAIECRKGNKEKAQTLWKQLLALPKEERKYRSVWAAWMLARTAEENPLQWYKEVEKLVDAGFTDSLNITKNKEDWHVYFGYLSGESIPALQHYIAQGKAKAISRHEAATSLITVLNKGLALGEEKLLKDAMEDPELRMVVCRYLETSCTLYHYYDRGKLEDVNVNEATKVTMEKWGKLLKSSEADVSAEASVMAACCYRNLWYDQSKEWLKLVKKDTVDSLFLRGKFAVMDGDYAKAEKYYAKLPAMVDPEGKGTGEIWDFGGASRGVSVEGARVFAAYGEYAIILLGRKNFKQALVYFDKGGDTSDAAYVAESLLSADELMSVVDAHYPAAGQETSWVRELLGRRLAREHRFADARKYLSETVFPKLDAYAKLYGEANDKKLEIRARAQKFDELAGLHLDYADSLFGLENGCRPETRVIAAGLPVDPRYETSDWVFVDPVKMSADEKTRFRKYFRRISPHPVAKYDAAEYLYKGAMLLPKNDENAAVMLWQAGCYLKDGDSVAADKYYQALVRHCGATELGKLADEKRWFPVGDYQLKW